LIVAMIASEKGVDPRDEILWGWMVA